MEWPRLPLAELAASCTQRATLLNQVGRMDEAMDDYRRGIDVFQRLFNRSGSEDEDPRWEMKNEKARLHNNLALLLDARQDPEALAEFGRAIDLRSSLVERSGHLEVRSRPGLHLQQPGQHARQPGKPAAGAGGLQPLHRAVQPGRRRTSLADLAMAHNNCGQTLVDLDRTDQALQHFTHAIDLYHPPGGARRSNRYRDLLALSCFNRACALESCGRFKKPAATSRRPRSTTRSWSNERPPGTSLRTSRRVRRLCPRL